MKQCGYVTPHTRLQVRNRLALEWGAGDGDEAKRDWRLQMRLKSSD